MNTTFCCPHCGKEIPNRSPVTLKRLLISSLVALIAWGAVWVSSDKLIGTKPTATLAALPPASKTAQEDLADPVLVKLRAAADVVPKDLIAIKALGSALIDKLKNSESPSQGLILEAVDTFSTILKIAPQDPEALVTLADLSFEQKLFDKSADLYQRYLSGNSDDLAARGRYGSTLTFLGKFDEAQKELKTIIEKDPKNFHAHAYLAITLAEKGDMIGAKSLGEKAIALAPNEEAGSRLREFLVLLEKKAVDKLQQNEPPKDVATGKLNLDEFYSTLKNHPIAGSKFVRGEVKEKTLLLYFKDFPMQQMPPFARDKFFETIKSSLGSSEITTIKFIDDSSGAEMAATSF